MNNGKVLSVFLYAHLSVIICLAMSSYQHMTLCLPEEKFFFGNVVLLWNFNLVLAIFTNSLMAQMWSFVLYGCIFICAGTNLAMNAHKYFSCIGCACLLQICKLPPDAHIFLWTHTCCFESLWHVISQTNQLLVLYVDNWNIFIYMDVNF